MFELLWQNLNTVPFPNFFRSLQKAAPLKIKRDTISPDPFLSFWGSGPLAIEGGIIRRMVHLS
jgi:hypothetical protein